MRFAEPKPGRHFVLCFLNWMVRHAFSFSSFGENVVVQNLLRSVLRSANHTGVREESNKVEGTDNESCLSYSQDGKQDCVSIVHSCLRVLAGNHRLPTIVSRFVLPCFLLPV